MTTLEQALESRVEHARRDDVIHIGNVEVTIHWHIEWHKPAGENVSTIHRGTCLSVDPLGWSTYPEQMSVAATGQLWRMRMVANRERPWRIDGVADGDLAGAAEILADTVRADTVYRRLISARGERARHALVEAADAWDAAGGTGWAGMQVRDHRNVLIERALAIGDLTPEEIRDAARVDDGQLRRSQSQVDSGKYTYTIPPLYLGVETVAARLGVTPPTIRSYRSRGAARLPHADIEIGGNPGWEWDTIDGYQRRRRGRGWAAGTTADLTGHRS
jgi:hypothetical protein